MVKIIQPTEGSRGTYKNLTPKQIQFSTGESLGLWNQDSDALPRDVTTFWKDSAGRVWVRQFQQASAQPIPLGGLYQKVIENDFETALIIDQTSFPDLGFHSAKIILDGNY